MILLVTVKETYEIHTTFFFVLQLFVEKNYFVLQLFIEKSFTCNQQQIPLKLVSDEFLGLI